MSIITKSLKISQMHPRKRLFFYVLLFTLFVNAVIVIFNFLFTFLGYCA